MKISAPYYYFCSSYYIHDYLPTFFFVNFLHFSTIYYLVTLTCFIFFSSLCISYFLLNVLFFLVIFIINIAFLPSDNKTHSVPTHRVNTFKWIVITHALHIANLMNLIMLILCKYSNI